MAQAKEIYYPGMIVVSERFLRMLKETGILIPPSYYDRSTGKLHPYPMREEDIKKAKEWYERNP